MSAPPLPPSPHTGEVGANHQAMLLLAAQHGLLDGPLGGGGGGGGGEHSLDWSMVGGFLPRTISAPPLGADPRGDLDRMYRNQSEMSTPEISPTKLWGGGRQ